MHVPDSPRRMRSGVGGVRGAATGQPPFPRLLPWPLFRRRTGHHQLVAPRPVQLLLHDDDVTVLLAAVRPAIGAARVPRAQSLVLAAARRSNSSRLARPPSKTDRSL